MKIAADTAIAGVASIIPPVGVAYAAFKAINFGYKLYQLMERDDHKGALGEITRTFSSELAEKLSEPNATRLSQVMTGLATTAGLISEVSSRTGVNAGTYSKMLEGTTKGAMTSGIGNLTEYVIEGSMAI